jgi:Reverse transcriptase (RNA-dependent DNA polymerase)/Endonuclease-reverse transcriptase
MAKFMQLNTNRQTLAVGEIKLRASKGEFDAVFLQEPSTYNGNVVSKINGGKCFYTKGKERPRACIWINHEHCENWECAMIGELSDKDNVAVSAVMKFKGACYRMLLVSCYLPIENEVNKSKICSILSYARDSNLGLILCMDSNAHNSFWGSKNDNKRGNQLMDLITEFELRILNRGTEPTWVSPRCDKIMESCIDITIVSKNIKEYMGAWKLLDESLFSDHKAIVFDIKTSKCRKKLTRVKRVTNWKKYSEYVSTEMDKNVWEINNVEDLNVKANLLGAIITKGFESNNKQRAVKSKFFMDWFDPRLQEERRQLRKLWSKINRTKKTNLGEANRLAETFRAKRDVYRKHVNTARNKAWGKKIEQIDNTKETAKFLKFMEPRACDGIEMLKKVDGTITKSLDEAIKCLMETHFPGCKEVITEAEEEEREDSGPRTDAEVSLVKAITEEGNIETAIESMGAWKSAGGDGIFPALLQKAGNCIFEPISKLCEASLMYSTIPKTWRDTKIVFLPKQGRKNYADAKSYRPISLMSFVLKLNERLVERYIRSSILTDDNNFHSNQHAYRKGMGTESALHKVLYKIEKSLKEDNVVRAIFIDICGAFDHTPHEIIESAAKKKKIPKIIIAWIMSMLKQRKIFAEIGGKFKKFKTAKGCPQGGILSPLLWSLVIDSLIRRLERAGIYVIAYADDLVLLLIQKSNLTYGLDVQTQKAAEIIEEWCKENGLSVNPEKSASMVFHRKKTKPKLMAMEMFGGIVPEEKVVKYLGIYIDEKLNWNAHIGHAIEKSKKTCWAARSLITKKFKLNTKLSLWVINQIWEPRLTYGCHIWWKALEKRTVRDRLLSEQGNALCIATGCMKLTPRPALMAIMNVTQIDIKIKSLAVKAFNRLNFTGQWEGIIDWGKSHTLIIREIPNNLKLDFRKERLNFSNRNNLKFITVLRDNEEEEVLDSQKDVALYVFFVDGSRRNEKAGIGIVCDRLSLDISIRIADNSNINIAECTAIMMAAKIANDRNIRGIIKIKSDAKSVITKMKNEEISRDNIKSFNALIRLSENCEVLVEWSPKNGHGIGNSRAHRRAIQALNKKDVDLKLEPSEKDYDSKIKKWEKEEAIKAWEESKLAFKHSSENIVGYDTVFTNILVSASRREMKNCISALTGLATCKYILYKMGRTTDDECRLCRDGEESMRHLLFECEALNYDRNKFLDNSVNLKKVNVIKRLIKFMNNRELVRILGKVKDPDLY